MGYDIGFTKRLSDGVIPKDVIYWESCGWEYSDFYNQLACLASKKIDEYTCCIPVKNIEFIADIYLDLKNTMYYQDIEIISAIDYDYLEKYFNSLNMFEIIDIMRCFYQTYKEENNDWMIDITYKEIGSFLWKSFKDGDTSFISSLGKGILEMIEDEIEEVYLWQSY